MRLGEEQCRGPHPPVNTKRPHPKDQFGQGQKVSFDKCSPRLYMEV